MSLKRPQHVKMMGNRVRSSKALSPVRVLFVCALFLFPSCSRRDRPGTEDLQITRVVINPQEFLGDVACELEGGMMRYQATLWDVTEGLERAFILPSSSIVSCRSRINFEFVAPGHLYIAKIVGFDRTGLRVQNPGSPVVVDSEGRSVVPRWTSTCWGDDRFLVGGQGMAGDSGVTEVGTAAYFRTAITMRGCERLSSATPADATSVAFDINPSLLGLECGEGAGQISSFGVVLRDDDAEPAPPSTPPEMNAGGAGGDTAMDGEEPISIVRTACGQTLVLSDLPAGQNLSFNLLAFERDSDTPRWGATCAAATQMGATVMASCSTLAPL